MKTQYGLIKGQKNAVPARKPLSKPSAFDVNEDEDEPLEGPTQIKRVNQMMISTGSRAVKDAERMYESAIAEDANVFDYDAAYDHFKSGEAAAASKRKETADATAAKSKYVENLLAMSKVREKEKERIYERKLLKERQLEDEKYGDLPQFMTSAYKKKLMEEKKWNYEDSLAEEVEKRTDVRGGGMQGFYANLLTRNIAMGGDVSKSAVSAYTAGSSRQEKMLQEENETQGHMDGKDGSDKVNGQSEVASTGNTGELALTGSVTANLQSSDRGAERNVDEAVTRENLNAEERGASILSARDRFLARKKRRAEESEQV